MSSLLRNIPSVSEVLESPPLKSLVQRASRHSVVTQARRFLDNLRTQVQAATANVSVPAPAELAQQIADWITRQDQSGIVPVLNATGVIVHPQLGSAPLAEDALAAASALGRGPACWEMDLPSGAAAERTREIEAALIRRTGSEAAAVVNSGSGALVAAVAALAGSREVLVARGQLAQWQSGSRVADLVAAAGAVVREVGATNSTRSSDYTDVLCEKTGAILHARASGYAVVGQTEIVALSELAALGRRNNLPVVDYLEQAAFVDLARFGLADCPIVSSSVASGADLVVFDTSQWIGGPECGAIVGRRSWIDQVKRHPLLPAVAPNRLAIATLAATLSLYEEPELAERAVPVLSLLTTPLENLRQRAERLAPQIAACGVASVELIEGRSAVSGDGLASHTLPTILLSLLPATGTAEALDAAVRAARPPVLGRLAEGRLWLDLRSMPPRDDLHLVAAFESLRPANAESASRRAPASG